MNSGCIRWLAIPCAHIAGVVRVVEATQTPWRPAFYSTAADSLPMLFDPVEMRELVGIAPARKRNDARIGGQVVRAVNLSRPRPSDLLETVNAVLRSPCAGVRYLVPEPTLVVREGVIWNGCRFRYTE